MSTEPLGEGDKMDEPVPSKPEDTHAKELAELLKRQAKEREKLTTLERKIYEYEGSYFKSSGKYGNIVSGYDGYLENVASPSFADLFKTIPRLAVPKKEIRAKPKVKPIPVRINPVRLKPPERIFSKSSVTFRRAVPEHKGSSDSESTSESESESESDNDSDWDYVDTDEEDTEKVFGPGCKSPTPKPKKRKKNHGRKMKSSRKSKRNKY